MSVEVHLHWGWLNKKARSKSRKDLTGPKNERGNYLDFFLEVFFVAFFFVVFFLVFAIATVLRVLIARANFI